MAVLYFLQSKQQIKIAKLATFSLQKATCRLIFQKYYFGKMVDTFA